jgi:hypothetical protein
VGDLMGYIMRDGPVADRRTGVLSPPVRDPAAALVLLQLRSPRWSSRRHAKDSFLLSRNRLWFSPAPAASFFTSAMRQAVAAIARFTVIGCYRLVK